MGTISMDFKVPVQL